MSEDSPGAQGANSLRFAVVVLSAGFAGLLVLALGAGMGAAVVVGLVTGLLSFGLVRPRPGFIAPSLRAATQPDNIPVWEAELLARRGSYEEAIVAYEQLISLHPEHIELHAAIAELRFGRLSDYPAAAKEWSTALGKLEAVSAVRRRALEEEGQPAYWRVRLEDCRRKMSRRQDRGLDSVELPETKGRF